MVEFQQSFSLPNKLPDPGGKDAIMTPGLAILERPIRPARSLGGSTNVSIAEPPEVEEGGSCRERIRRYWLSDIDRNWTDILLIVCGYISGLVEGLSLNYWGSFSNMQTGMPSPCRRYR